MKNGRESQQCCITCEFVPLFWAEKFLKDPTNLDSRSRLLTLPRFRLFTFPFYLIFNVSELWGCPRCWSSAWATGLISENIIKRFLFWRDFLGTSIQKVSYKRSRLVHVKGLFRIDVDRSSGARVGVSFRQRKTEKGVDEGAGQVIRWQGRVPIDV